MLRCCFALALALFTVVAAETEPVRLGVVVDNAAFDISQGLPVKGVAPGSTAASLGVQVGDLMTAINGESVKSDADVLRVLTPLKVGDAITLQVRRNGELRDLAGAILAPPTAENLLAELGAMRGKVNELEQAVDARTREPTLAELIRELQLLQAQFPKAAAEFKKLYPNGEFSIVIRITSDKTAAEPVDLMNLPDPAKAVPAAPEGAAPKPPGP